jgi:hypothetical protein
VQVSLIRADGLEVDIIGFGEVLAVSMFVVVAVELVLLLLWMLRVGAGLGLWHLWDVGSLPFLQKDKRGKKWENRKGRKSFLIRVPFIHVFSFVS